MPGTLYLIPNLLGLIAPEQVLPVRTIDIARRLEHFVVETPKAARAFLRTVGHERPLAELSFATLDEHTPLDAVDALLAPALGGCDVGVVSDAGCPAVADPGALLVAAAHRHGVRVIPLVGPSAILLGLMASGLDGQRFSFHGYLPAKPEPRRQRLRVLDQVLVQERATQIFIETPYRNDALVADVVKTVSAAAFFCVAADLTLPTESIRCQSIGRWRQAPPLSFARRPAIFLLGVPAERGRAEAARLIDRS